MSLKRWVAVLAAIAAAVAMLGWRARRRHADEGVTFEPRGDKAVAA